MVLRFEVIFHKGTEGSREAAGDRRGQEDKRDRRRYKATRREGGDRRM